MLTLDGKTYKAEWIADSFTRTAEIINGDNSGRLQGTKAMFLEYVGTFFNFKGTLMKKGGTDEEWDELFMALSNPKNDHTVTVPFNQKVMTTQIYIASLSQSLKKVEGRTNKWAKTIEVSFVSMEPQWFYGKTITGIEDTAYA